MRVEERVQERIRVEKKRERKKRDRREKKKSQGAGVRKEGPSLGISKPELCGSWGDVRQLSGLM